MAKIWTHHTEISFLSLSLMHEPKPLLKSETTIFFNSNFSSFMEHTAK